jgi:hypothetical protein
LSQFCYAVAVFDATLESTISFWVLLQAAPGGSDRMNAQKGGGVFKRRALLVVLTVSAMLLLAGNAPGSNAVARDLSPAQEGMTFPVANRPGHVAPQRMSQSAMAASGGPIGSRFIVADQSVDTTESAVAYNSQNQEYLVVWQTEWPANDDIYGQRVSKNGGLVSHWFSIAAGAGTDRRYPDVVYNSQHNEYLVIWSEGGTAVRAQRVSATGLLLGSPLFIAVAAPGDYLYFPAIAYGSTPDAYLVAFVQQTGLSYSTIGVVACAYGAFICLADSVGPSTTTYHSEPEVAYNPRRNEFLVVWREYISSAKHIYGRQVSLSSGLSLLGSNFQISSVSNNEDSPAVAVVPRNPDGQYMVAWYTYDGTARGNIWAQRLAGDGTLEGGAIPLARTLDDETGPAIAGNANNEQYLITWTRRDATNTHSNIQGQAIYTNGSFASEVRDMIPAPAGLVGPTTPANSALAAGPNGEFLVTFDDPLSSVRKVYGILWGDRVYLPLLKR